MARENFYIILELPFDPPEEEEEVILKAIEKKRLEWSKGSTDFKRGPIYRAYSAMLPEIREVMLDGEKRRKEYEQAYQITYEKARHMLAIIEKRGYLYESEIVSISKRLKVTEDIVRCACKVRIVEDELKETSFDKPPGADKFKVFQVYLDTLNKKDYYDFINYNGTMKARLRDMPPFRLVELVKQQRITYARNTPEESAIEKLCAECEKTFSTVESKKEYDDYLIWKKTEEVYEQVQIATELTKVLDEGQCEETIKLLHEVIDNRAQCVDMLKSYCRQNGIAMEYGNFTPNRQGKMPNTNARANGREMQKQRQQELRRVQPNMPKNLRIQVDTMKRCNYVTWEKTTMDNNVSYLIVRKRGKAPYNINDGELLGTVSGTTYTDASIYPGKLYYYAVFAVKRGVYSKGISTQVGYLNLFEVEAATAVVKEGHVELSWTNNYRELRVVIFRQDLNAPMDYGDGKLCYNASYPAFKDVEVKPGTTYYYRIFTSIYINGKRFTSKGVIVTVEVPAEKKKLPTRSAREDIKKEEAKTEEKKEEIKKEEATLKSVRPVWKEEKKSKIPPMKPTPYMTPKAHVDSKNNIFYDIKVRKGILKPKSIEIIFTGNAENFVLPPLLIIGAKNYPPSNKDSGVLLGTIEKQFVKKKYVHAISLLSVEGLDYIKLFLANASDEGQFEIHLKYGSSSKFT